MGELERIQYASENVSVSMSSNSFVMYRKSGVNVLCTDSTLAQLLPTLKEKFPISEITIKANQQVGENYPHP